MTDPKKNPFLRPDGSARQDGDPEDVPTIHVMTQHAVCPDAQCPRAKMENIGYTAYGYNILRGNPMPTSPGIDPGYLVSPMYNLKYDLSLETADGRYQMPDFVVLQNEVGCSLAMSSTETTSTRQYQDSLSLNAKVEGSGSYGLADVAFSASVAYQSASSSLSTEKNVKLTSTADCSVYSTRGAPTAAEPSPRGYCAHYRRAPRPRSRCARAACMPGHPARTRTTCLNNDNGTPVRLPF